jgi:hypothetical protein
VHHNIRYSAVKLAGAGDAAAGRDGEGDDEPRASLWRELKLRGGGAGFAGAGEERGGGGA